MFYNRVLGLLMLLAVIVMPGTSAADPTLSDEVMKALRDKFGDKQFIPAKSEVGDVAEGVVGFKNDDVLYLDIDPCSKESRVIVFTKPYVERQTGKTKKCNGKIHDVVSVRQK